MGKYSSDSDYEKRSGKRSESHKSSRRRRSDSSDSSESRSRRGNRDKRSIRTRRSRSRDRYSRSRRSASSSKSSSRLNSSKYRSSRRSRSKSRSRDRDRDRDRRGRLRRSRSRSYIREYSSRRRRSSSSSDSSSSKDSRGKIHKDKSALKKDSTKLAGNGKVDQSSAKPAKQEAAAPTVREEMPQFDSAALDEINSESFAPKTFYSDKKHMENIVINLKDQTIKVPEAENKPSEEATSLYYHNLFASEEARMQKWVKELYIYRQKALQQGVRRN